MTVTSECLLTEIILVNVLSEDRPSAAVVDKRGINCTTLATLTTLGLLRDFWETIDKLLRDYWETIERLLKDYWETIERLLRDCWETIERLLKDHWEIFERLMRGFWETVERMFQIN